MKNSSRLVMSLGFVALAIACDAEFKYEECAAGSVADNEKGKCVPCDAGTVPDPANGRCKPCDAGYTPDENWQCVPSQGAAGAAGNGGGGSGAGGDGGGRAGQGGTGGGAGSGAEEVPDLIAAGNAHTCARSGGEVRCWGFNSSGQLGVDTNFGVSSANPSPLLIDAATLGAVRQVALGSSHGCALRSDGRAVCWGNNGLGQLGSNTNLGATTPTPQLVDSTLGSVRQLALGDNHSCALRDDGRVLCWGYNKSGQLGTNAFSGTEAATPVPQLIDDGALGVVRQLAAGGKHTCAVRDDGRVLCWGSNKYGQLGNTVNSGNDLDNAAPQLVDDGALGVVRQIATGLNHTCAVRDDGRVLCWGQNENAQLGSAILVGTGGPTTNPLLVESSDLGVVKQVAAGSYHTCALREDGRVLCWGGNFIGQLGVNINIGGAPLPAPQLLDNGVLGVVRELALGAVHSCAVRADGRMLCWGSNEYGRLGSTTSSDTNPTPLPVQGLSALTP